MLRLLVSGLFFPLTNSLYAWEVAQSLTHLDRPDRLCSKRLWHLHLPVEAPSPRVPLSALIPTAVNPFYAKSILIAILSYIPNYAAINASSVGEALRGGKSRLHWSIAILTVEDDELIGSNSDILNRHVLQHNVPPGGAKRTPLACQTCRRRKTKCDSNYPCSICAESGQLCVRESSSEQKVVPTSRPVLTGSLGEENRSIEHAEGVDYEGPGTPTMPSPDDTSPMRLYWNMPMDRSASNHAFNTRPTLINTGTDQDSVLPLTDPLMRMMSGINTSTSTPNRTPPMYFSGPSDIMSFSFDATVRQPLEARDNFVIDEPCEIHMSHVPTFTSSRGFSSEWDLQTTTFENDSDLASQIQILQCLG